MDKDGDQTNPRSFAAPVLPEILLQHRHEMIPNGATGGCTRPKQGNEGHDRVRFMPSIKGMDAVPEWIFLPKCGTVAKSIASACRCIILTKHLNILRKGLSAPTLGLLR